MGVCVCSGRFGALRFLVFTTGRHYLQPTMGYWRWACDGVRLPDLLGLGNLPVSVHTNSGKCWMPIVIC